MMEVVAAIPNYDFCPADKEILKKITKYKGVIYG